MINKYIIYFIILVLFVIILIKYNVKEEFISYYDWFSLPYTTSYWGYDQRYCKKCKEKLITDCTNCYNCGICVKDNISTCESGDADGPKVAKCDKWIYGTNTIGTPIVQPVTIPWYYGYYYDMFYPPYYYGSGYSGSTYSYPRYRHREIINKNYRKPEHKSNPIHRK